MTLFLILENIKIAFSAIWANKLRSFLTTLGIIIGVLSVTLMISLIEGLDEQIKSSLSDLGPELLTISPGNYEDEGFTLGAPPGTSDRIEQEDIDLIRDKVPEVAYITEVRQNTGATEYRGQEKKGFVVGVDPDFVKVFNQGIAAGEVFKRGETKKVVVLGKGIADEFFSDISNAIDKKVKVKGVSFKVVGVMKEEDMTFGNISMNDAVFIPSGVADREFKSVILEVDLLADSVDNVSLVERKIERVLEESHGKKDFSIFTPDETMDFLATITGFISTVLGAITGISLLVGGIGIMNIMLVSVTERTRQIGVRKAVGATDIQILFQFLVEAITLSIFGGSVGLGFASLIAQAITKFGNFPTSIDLQTASLAVGFSVFIGVLFGTAPAVKASKKNPIEALRYE